MQKRFLPMVSFSTFIPHLFFLENNKCNNIFSLFSEVWFCTSDFKKLLMIVFIVVEGRLLLWTMSSTCQSKVCYIPQ